MFNRYSYWTLGAADVVAATAFQRDTEKEGQVRMAIEGHRKRGTGQNGDKIKRIWDGYDQEVGGCRGKLCEVYFASSAHMDG